MASRSGFTLIEVLVTLAVLSMAGMALLQYAKQSEDSVAEVDQMDVLARLGAMQMIELETDGFSSSLSREEEFADYPGYVWTAKASSIHDGGWYKVMLVVRQKESGRSLVLERIFRERL